MNKKILGIIIAIMIILVAIVGIVYMVSNDSLNEQENNQLSNTSKENEKENIIESNNTSNAENVENDNNNSSENKNLVVYFSMAGNVYNVGNVEIGNTAIMASYIADYLNTDTFEIIPVKTYPTNHSDLINEAKEEQSQNARPEIKNKINNFEQYDTIFIGYPIWWGDLPQIVYTFLEKYDFSGKTIIPFNTHEGSGSSGTYNTIKNKLKNANVNTNGLAIQGKTARQESSRSTVEKWLKGLEY